jgi:hypothetical protein
MSACDYSGLLLLSVASQILRIEGCRVVSATDHHGRLSRFPRPGAAILATSGGRSVGIVRLRATATEFSLVASQLSSPIREVAVLKYVRVF